MLDNNYSMLIILSIFSLCSCFKNLNVEWIVANPQLGKHAGIILEGSLMSNMERGKKYATLFVLYRCNKHLRKHYIYWKWMALAWRYWTRAPVKFTTPFISNRWKLKPPYCKISTPTYMWKEVKLINKLAPFHMCSNSMFLYPLLRKISNPPP